VGILSKYFENEYTALICLFFLNEEVRTSRYFMKRRQLQKTLGTNAFAEPKPKFCCQNLQKTKTKVIALSTIDMDLFTTFKRKANSTEACG